MSGMTFELGTPHGRIMTTMLAGIAQFERDQISERVKSGLAEARAPGRILGRQPGHRPKSDRLAPRVLRLVGECRSYRWIARDLGISKNTVGDIVKRTEANEYHRIATANRPSSPVVRLDAGAFQNSACEAMTRDPGRTVRRQALVHWSRSSWGYSLNAEY